MSTQSVKLTIPGIPPSVNHYKKRSPKTGKVFLTSPSKKFKETVFYLARGKRLYADSYGVTVHVYLGFKQKGDLDNFLKITLDSLVSAGVIHSDAAVMQIVAAKFRDRANPRTEVEVIVLA